MTVPLKTILSFLVLVLSLNVHAQVYPVNGNAVLIPPYSVYLSDYTSRATERLVFNVVLKDVTRPELRVRLRMKIESQSIKLETKPEYRGAEIILQGGFPLRLSGTDLTEYFNPDNLNFSGITRREFEKTGALPEGFYQFSFEVLEYNRGVKISNAISAPGWLILNDPPIVNLPRNSEKLKPTQPQYLVFQWTPRHTGSPNSAFSTEYNIEMVEIWPANRNPNDAILTSPRILETSTQSTSFIYGPAETPLELGRQYAFRIQAKSIVGAEAFDLFKNNGYSEVVTFTYGDACEMPGNIRVETGVTKFKVGWDGQFNHSAYTFRYRPGGTVNWYESATAIDEVTIYSLAPNTTYEYQVAGACGVFEGQFTPIASLKTNDAGTLSYSCGLPLETFNLDPAELTGSLKVGDIIQAGDFEVKLTKVSGSNGVFTGEGVIEVPFFNKAKVKAEFTGIAVNKELRMVSGFMNVTGAGVEVVPSGVMDLMDDLSETLNQIDSALNDIEANLPQSFDPNSFVADTLITVLGPATVISNPDGSVTITDVDGNQHTLPPGTEAAIADSSGKGFLVDSKGNVHETTAENATQAGNREYNLKLKFDADPIAKYGFDERKYDALAPSYEQLEGGYNVAWKAVASGDTDRAIAKLEDTSIDKSKIHFELFSLPVQAPPMTDDHSTTVTVTGKSDGTIEDLIAAYSTGNAADKEQVLGKLKVITYDKIKHNLVIVPVNGNTYPGTATQLTQDINKIFGQAAVEWSVTLAEEISVSLDETFDDGESGLLSNYTDDMKKVINQYNDNQPAGMSDDSYYLFLVSKPKSGNLLGYMPRSKQAGFIFVDVHGNDPEKITHTMAHELGHGAFHLEHTFSQFTALTKSSTDNLMDYANGTHLFKYQWDNIHHPQIVIGLFEGDEAGASKSLFDSKYVRLHDALGTTAWASTKGKDEFTKDIIMEVDSTLAILDKEEKKTYILINYAWFDQTNIGKFEDIITRLSSSAKEKLGKELGTSDFNLLVVVNAKYDTALAGGLRGVSFREWFYPMNGLDAACTKAVKDYLNDESKKKFSDGLNEALKERAEKLLEKLKGCKVEKPKEIVIHYKRKGHNQYRTWGEFTIVGTDYKGYILERPKGSDPTRLQQYKRHPAGTYDIDYSEKSGVSSKFRNVTLNLVIHPSYILHCGNRADQSDGCLLINYNSPQFDKYPDAFQSYENDVNKPSEERSDNPDRLRPVSNDYPSKYPDKDGSAHANPDNPAYKLREKVKQMEDEIKSICKCENIVKKIIIDESEEKEEL